MSPNAYTEMSDVQTRHWWFVARRDILRSQLADLQLPPVADILEIGSGTGANLALLAEFGQVVGLEMSAPAIALARSHGVETGGRVDLIKGQCPEDLGGLARRFDLVCLFDVLEHIDNDAATLKALRTLLKPGGRVMLSVPAYQWLWGPHDEHLHHHRRYDAAQLKGSLEQAGLAISRISYFNTLLFPVAVAGRVVDRVLRRRSSSGSAIPAAPLNAVLRALFRLERHWLLRRRFPFGLSLLAVATSRND